MKKPTKTKQGFLAALMVCIALLLNEFVLFGNLNLNVASTFLLITVGLICFIGLMKPESPNTQEER
jgi:hypothetical protein